MGALEPLMFTGLGVVAVWVYVRFPDRRPTSITRAMVRVVLSFALFFVLPELLGAFFSVVHGRYAGAAFVIVAVMPSLGFVLQSWVWLLGRLAHDAGPRLPRRGHPAGAH